MNKTLLQVIGSYSEETQYVTTMARTKILPYMDMKCNNVDSMEKGVVICDTKQLKDNMWDLIERYTEQQYMWQDRAKWITEFA